jgi:hypothetical protein
MGTDVESAKERPGWGSAGPSAPQSKAYRRASSRSTPREWIDLLDPLAQIPLPILRDYPRGQQALQRCLGNIIHPTHLVALGQMRLELEGGAISN